MFYHPVLSTRDGFNQSEYWVYVFYQPEYWGWPLTSLLGMCFYQSLVLGMALTSLEYWGGALPV